VRYEVGQLWKTHPTGRSAGFVPLPVPVDTTLSADSIIIRNLVYSSCYQLALLDEIKATVFLWPCSTDSSLFWPLLSPFILILPSRTIPFFSISGICRSCRFRICWGTFNGFYPNVTIRPGLCYRKSVCRLWRSCVLLGVKTLGNISSPFCTLAIFDLREKFYGDRPRGTPPSGMASEINI